MRPILGELFRIQESRGTTLEPLSMHVRNWRGLEAKHIVAQAPERFREVEPRSFGFRHSD